jgi:acyl-CoA thioester hydrolase
VERDQSQARLLLVLRHLSGEPAATVQAVVAHATPRDGLVFPWPDRVRERAQSLAVQVPDYARARSVGIEAVGQSTASLAQADALGLVRIGMGVVGPGDCDVFGRMRAEQFMGRVSDGIPRLLGRRPTADEIEGPVGRIGGAALEYRLVHFEWPRAGDRLELRSGTASADGRFRRFVHWLLDPVTGRPWGAAEAIAVNFDLDARKMVRLTAEAQAAVAAQVIPGLAL